MTNDNNTPIDTTNVNQTPLNVAATDATVTTAGNITASTAAATTSTILPVGNAADETTRRSLFGAGLYQTGKTMTNDNNIPIDTTNVNKTPLNVAATDATVTTAGNITASTAAATTSTIFPTGNAADETTRRSLFGAGLYQTASERRRLPMRAPPPPSGRLGLARLGVGVGVGLSLGLGLGLGGAPPAQ
ncbi:hypothetical protein F2Q70_00031518 [Brassica cretica]|uniref:Uncharacterized protein n=1 Tax=Brassica cretica TaxID=69181 RepID=A0A8S9FM07_BRACR|nr:hypothetical protein F2Q70_00031518 [Brassica cretica]